MCKKVDFTFAIMIKMCINISILYYASYVKPRVNIFATSTFPGGMFNLKKIGKGFIWRRTVIN